MRAGRIAERDPGQVAAHLFHGLLGHFVAEAIAGAPAREGAGPDPFLLHLVETIARDLEPGAARRARPGRKP
jgi:hypothetical protein